MLALLDRDQIFGWPGGRGRQNDFSPVLSCVLLNSRSILNKVIAFTAEIVIEGNFPDIIAITETWLTENDSDALLPYNALYDVTLMLLDVTVVWAKVEELRL